MDSGSPVPLFDPRRVRFFHFAFTHFFSKHMRACRLARWSAHRDVPPGVPLVVFANHPSWWDGVAFMLLTQGLFRGRPMFSPIEAKALEKYAFMKRLGCFGIETGTPRGAIRFLRVAQEVLATPSHMLWMNAPGRFCDVRERPVPIVPGLTRLPDHAPGAVFMPLALDYPFWTERGAEMLCAFGPPVAGAELLALDRDARAARFAAMLEAVMDRLAEDAIARDPARFEVLVQGREGMGGIWQRWRRMAALLRGQPFDPRHDTSRGVG